MGSNPAGGHIVGPYWVPGHAGVRGNEITDMLARDGAVQKFIGPQPCLGGLYAEHKEKDEAPGG